MRKTNVHGLTAKNCGETIIRWRGQTLKRKQTTGAFDTERTIGRVSQFGKDEH